MFFVGGEIIAVLRSGANVRPWDFRIMGPVEVSGF